MIRWRSDSVMRSMYGLAKQADSPSFDERRRSCDDSLRTGYVHNLEEKIGEVLHNPLHAAVMIQHLHKCGNREDQNRELLQQAERREANSRGKTTVLAWFIYHVKWKLSIPSIGSVSRRVRNPHSIYFQYNLSSSRHKVRFF
jgi:hypothetical protein